MDAFLFMVLLGVGFLLPFAMAGYLFYWLWKKGGLWKITGVVIAGLFSYLIYDAFYPSDSFFQGEFEHISGVNFPKSGVITQKHASYPDIHGDYESCALFELSAEDYKLLKEKLLSDKKHETSQLSTVCGSINLENQRVAIGVNSFNKNKNEHSGWGVLKDAPIVYFTFWSS